MAKKKNKDDDMLTQLRSELDVKHGRPVTTGWKYKQPQRTMEHAEYYYRHGRSKLCPEIIEHMAEMLRDGCTMKEICEEVGISTTCMSMWQTRYPTVRKAFREAREQSQSTYFELANASRHKAGEILYGMLDKISKKVQKGQIDDINISGRDLLKLMGMDGPDSVVNITNIGQVNQQKVVQFVDSDAKDDDGRSVEDRFKQIELEMEQAEAARIEQVKKDEGIIDVEPNEDKEDE